MILQSIGMISESPAFAEPCRLSLFQAFRLIGTFQSSLSWFRNGTDIRFLWTLICSEACGAHVACHYGWHSLSFSSLRWLSGRRFGNAACEGLGIPFGTPILSRRPSSHPSQACLGPWLLVCNTDSGNERMGILEPSSYWWIFEPLLSRWLLRQLWTFARVEGESFYRTRFDRICFLPPQNEICFLFNRFDLLCLNFSYVIKSLEVFICLGSFLGMIYFIANDVRQIYSRYHKHSGFQICAKVFWSASYDF